MRLLTCMCFTSAGGAAASAAVDNLGHAVATVMQTRSRCKSLLIDDIMRHQVDLDCFHKHSKQ
jgi:hypothetical protein